MSYQCLLARGFNRPAEEMVVNDVGETVKNDSYLAIFNEIKAMEDVDKVVLLEQG